MALTLVVLSGNTSHQVPLTLDGPRIVVGRAANSDVRLPDYSVSARHATFRQRGSDYLIVDEGSTNGTFVGPVRLSPQATRVVRSGDLLRFGRIWVEVQIESVPVTSQPASASKELAMRLVADALAANRESTEARVVVESGPDAGAQLVIEHPERRYILGRAHECDLVLVERNASRRHVEVFLRNNQIYTRDLGSKNGTLFAGMPLPSKQESAWSTGAKMQLGNDHLSLVDPVAEALIEIEGAADEVMPEDEEVPPPRRKLEALSSSVRYESRTPTATVQYSKNKGPAVHAKGVTVADIAVGLLSLVVLGISLFGLFWLLSGR